MIGWWKRVYREFQANMIGLREGLISIAERVNSSVQRARSSIAASELNQSLQSEFVRLGCRVYDLNQVRRAGLLSDPEVKALFEKAGEIDRHLEEIDALAQQNAQAEMTDQLRDLQQALQTSKKVVEQWEVGSYSGCSGKKLQELALPEGIFLLLIIRQGRVFSPAERLHLSPGDALFMVGPPLKLSALKSEMIG
jgi:hypothetical protein